MSLCHIWLGVARSKNRGRVTFRRCLAGVGGSISFAVCSVCRTVSLLTPRQNQRFSVSVIRCTPKSGCCCFISITWSRSAGAIFARRVPVDFGYSPASPSAW